MDVYHHNSNSIERKAEEYIVNINEKLENKELVQLTNKEDISLIEDEEGDRFEFAYDMKQLYRVIHSIPEDMKVPFQMFVAGFKYREIAEKLGLPMGTVKSRLFFIRKRLKEELKDFS